MPERARFAVPQERGAALVMGILNCTPDSFSDGEQATVRARVEKGLRLVAEGADILDLGGESTRPGAEPVGADEELARVIPVIEGLRRECATPISIDTAKARVARAALLAGADIINDITALRGEGDMAGTAAEFGAPLILMHMQGTPRDMQHDPQYANVVAEVGEFLRGRAEYAVSRGVRREDIILDPGFGFGKNLAHNARLFLGLEELAGLGYPLLVGVSRKSMIGQALGLPVQERLEGGLALAVMAAERGAAILRVHDVKETARALHMRRALYEHGGTPPQ